MNTEEETVGKSERWNYAAEYLYEISCYRYNVDKSNAKLLIAVMIQAARDLYNHKISAEDLISAHEYFDDGHFDEDCKLLALDPAVTRQLLVSNKNANFSN